MIAKSSMFRLVSVSVPLALLVHRSNGLDLEFDSIVCNQSLPAYVHSTSMTCNDGDKRCTFGSTVTIAGTSKLLQCIVFV